MARLQLFAASITAAFTILLAAAAVDDGALLKTSTGDLSAAAQRWLKRGVSSNQTTRRTRPMAVF